VQDGSPKQAVWARTLRFASLAVLPDVFQRTASDLLGLSAFHRKFIAFSVNIFDTLAALSAE